MLAPLLSLLLLANTATVFEPRPVSSKKYFEGNTVIAYADDGTYVQGLLVVSNIGLGNRHGACRLLVVSPGLPTVSAMESVDPDDWHATSEPSPLLVMGPCRVSTTSTSTQLMMHVQDTAVVIALSKPAVRFVPPGTPVTGKDWFYESDILVPFSPAEIVLTRGGKTETLHGFGYADHSRSTALPAQLARGWVRFRGVAKQQPNCARIVLARFPEGATTPAQGYVWNEGATQPEELLGWSMPMPPQDADPNSLKIDFKGPDRTLQIRGVQRLMRQAPLEDYGLLGRIAGAWVGSVVGETFEAILDDSKGCHDVHGILEVDHNTR